MSGDGTRRTVEAKAITVDAPGPGFTLDELEELVRWMRKLGVSGGERPLAYTRGIRRPFLKRLTFHRVELTFHRIELDPTPADDPGYDEGDETVPR